MRDRTRSYWGDKPHPFPISSELGVSTSFTLSAISHLPDARPIAAGAGPNLCARTCVAMCLGTVGPGTGHSGTGHPKIGRPEIRRSGKAGLIANVLVIERLAKPLHRANPSMFRNEAERHMSVALPRRGWSGSCCSGLRWPRPGHAWAGSAPSFLINRRQPTLFDQPNRLQLERRAELSPHHRNLRICETLKPRRPPHRGGRVSTEQITGRAVAAFGSGGHSIVEPGEPCRKRCRAPLGWPEWFPGGGLQPVHV